MLLPIVKAILGIVGLLVVGLFVILNDIWPPVPSVPVVEKTYFGPGKRPQSESSAITPFAIKFDAKDWEGLKLRIRLDRERLASVKPLEGAGFTYGFNTDYLVNNVAEYWLNKYDWNKQKKAIEKLPQFTTKIDGLDIHFVHVKPSPEDAKGKTVLPLLIVHGWPGSFLEFAKMIPLLTKSSPDRDFVFEIVAPSIPGYGFSSAPSKKGFSAYQCARIFLELMNRLNHKTFYAQGGDWGSLITTILSIVYPESVTGLHLNMVLADTPSAKLKTMLSAIVPSLVMDTKDQWKVLPLSEKFSFLLEESGYLHIQSTKPDTVGTGLTTSPLGLAAYILEKFSTWTNKKWRSANDGNLTVKYTMDELIDNLMVYWISGNIISSQRFYAENIFIADPFKSCPVTVPTGVAMAPEEVMLQPESFLGGKYRNIVSFTDMKSCGHFAAMEEPVALADDIVQFVGKVQKLYPSQQNDEL